MRPAKLLCKLLARIMPAMIGVLCIFALNALIVEGVGAQDRVSRSKARSSHLARDSSIKHAKKDSSLRHKIEKSNRRNKSKAKPGHGIFKHKSSALAPHKKIRVKAARGQFVGIFTAYTPKVTGRAQKRRLTADETDLKDSSSCIVANNKLRLGTRITIEGIGTCEVHDRIGKKVGANRFDIFMRASPGNAKDFGRRKLKYKIERA